LRLQCMRPAAAGRALKCIFVLQALLNREVGEACQQEGPHETHQASLDRLALITEAAVAKAADVSDGITAEGGADCM
jgi:hypothetical protein